MSEQPLRNLKEYLFSGKTFVIPNYQRGYVWGKSRRGNQNDTDSVSFFLDSLIEGCENKAELFLQGVTVTQTADRITIIDGQQRTTLLYLIFLYLENDQDLRIEYAVRKGSDAFLQELKGKTRSELLEMCAENPDEPYQDLYYFKKSMRIIDQKLQGRNAQDTIDYLLEKVNLLYITIDQADPKSVFAMMNGNKADMLPQEVIKADLLRLVSQPRPDQEQTPATEWDTQMVRSRYAREWDKWLCWWNQKEVQQFYGTTEVMGRLIETFFTPENNGALTYQAFKKRFLERSDSVLAAKRCFGQLRELQKRFEDTFSDAALHNSVGFILTVHQEREKRSFLKAYFGDSKINDHNRAADLACLGLGPTISDAEKIKEAYDNTLQAITNENLYQENTEVAYRLLLWRNVQADTHIGRPFDFKVWANRSLEHIHPQSTAELLSDISVHSIGNLALLYKNENSAFSNAEFNVKKQIYFDLANRTSFHSRHLLHTIALFAHQNWDSAQITANKEAFIQHFKNHFSAYCNEPNNE